jgi:glycosyltransferase involved in cell wall biosynthesis
MGSRLRSNPLTRAAWQAGGESVRLIRRTWPAARSIAQTIRQQSIALVHLNDTPTAHRAGIIGSRMAGVPCICHARSLVPLAWLDHLLTRSVARFIFISRAVADFHHTYGIASGRGVVVHNALDLSPYQALDRAGARRALGLRESHIGIGSVGRLVPWKGQHVLLSALSTLPPRFPHLRCFFAGTPESHTVAYQQQLQDMTVQLGLAGMVRFLGFEDDIPRLLAALDMVVHSAIEPEPFGRVLIEGMAAGLPIIATNGGGAPEVVVDGETGLLVPPNDASALAAAIARLAEDPALGRALGARGRQRASEQFAIEHHVAAIENVYRSVLNLGQA